MSKKNKSRSSQPQPELTGPDQATMPTADVIELQNRSGRRVNALEAHNARISEAVRSKVTLMKEAEEALAETVKLAGDLAGDIEHARENEAKIEEASNKAAFLLFRGRTYGILSPDEVSEMLGRTFGWKRKQNGEQSKTPFGQGESIRKRVQRGFDAWNYIRGGEPKAFFEPLPRETVAQMVREVEEGNRSLYTLYNDLADLKAEVTGKRPKPAFDPKRIVALQSSLSENIAATVQIVHDTPGLFEAYAGLLRTLQTIGEEYSVAYPDAVKAA